MAKWARRGKRRRYNWAFMLAGARDGEAESAPVASAPPSVEHTPSVESVTSADPGEGPVLGASQP